MSVIGCATKAEAELVLKVILSNSLMSQRLLRIHIAKMFLRLSCHSSACKATTLHIAESLSPCILHEVEAIS